jgi:hypothetical protein
MGLGQFTGSRGKFIYTSDSGKEYILTLDTDLNIVGSGLIPYDPLTNATAQSPPKGFRPRVVFWQATAAAFLGKRKSLVAGVAAEDLYSADAPQSFTVDGVAGTTTGKKGERLSFI